MEFRNWMVFLVMLCFEEVLNAQAGVCLCVFQIWDEECSSDFNQNWFGAH